MTFALGGLEKSGGIFPPLNSGKGLRSVLSPASEGDSKRVKLVSLDGLWLAGRVGGGLEIDLGKRDIGPRKYLQGETLNPSPDKS